MICIHSIHIICTYIAASLSLWAYSQSRRPPQIGRRGVPSNLPKGFQRFGIVRNLCTGVSTDLG